MQTKKSTVSRRQKLTNKLTMVGPFMEGTLAVTQRTCGRKGCACLRGKKHSAMYLTWKEERKTQAMYIPVGKQKEALLMSQNYKKLKKLIRQLSELHKKALAHNEGL